MTDKSSVRERNPVGIRKDIDREEIRKESIR